jgi:hypothetical protein
MSAPIFDAAQQQRRAVGQARRAGIEDGVRRIGPVRGRQNRILRVPVEERLVGGNGS